MTKNELLTLLRDLPGDTEICGFNSEFSTEYEPCTAVFIPKGGTVSIRKSRRGGADYPITSPKNVLVLTEFGDEPTKIALDATTIWSKS